VGACSQLAGDTNYYSWYHQLNPAIIRFVAPTARRPRLTPLPGEGDLGLVDGLAQLSFAVQAVLGRVAAAHDASIVQARLLGILRDRTPTINELAGLLELDKSSVTGLVDRAQERGLVIRIASTVDRRSVQVVLTDAGQDLIDQAGAAFEAELSALVADLTAAQRTSLSATASLVVAAYVKQRGVDIFTMRSDPVRPGRPGMPLRRRGANR
jgi:MarR family transcriptional regulator, lower aerobic nicotinate degradation pathway regulator